MIDGLGRKGAPNLELMPQGRGYLLVEFGADTAVQADERARALAEERGATVTDKVIERHQAFVARHDTNGAACSATTAAGTGVLSWWVQTRGKTDTDPCTDAEKLLAATLSSDL